MWTCTCTTNKECKHRHIYARNSSSFNFSKIYFFQFSLSSYFILYHLTALLSQLVLPFNKIFFHFFIINSLPMLCCCIQLFHYKHYLHAKSLLLSLKDAHTHTHIYTYKYLCVYLCKLECLSNSAFRLRSDNTVKAYEYMNGQTYKVTLTQKAAAKKETYERALGNNKDIR